MRAQQRRHDTAVAHTKPSSAKETVTAFYDLYLKALSENRDPFTQDKAFIKRFVAPSLIAEIEQRLKSPDGMEADYFIQAQDYLDEWKGNVFVSEHENQLKVTPLAVISVVTLGPNSASGYRLKVTTKKEAGGWKISKVQKMGDL